MVSSIDIPEKIPVIDGVMGLHHVALAVKDLDEALKLWTNFTGATLDIRAVMKEQGVEAACVAWGEQPTQLELIAPLNIDSGVQKFIDKNGSGIHHLAFSVKDIKQAINSCQSANIRVINQVPRIGLHGTLVTFLHPKSLDGVLVELVEHE